MKLYPDNDVRWTGLSRSRFRGHLTGAAQCEFREMLPGASFVSRGPCRALKCKGQHWRRRLRNSANRELAPQPISFPCAWPSRCPSWRSRRCFCSAGRAEQLGCRGVRLSARAARRRLCPHRFWPVRHRPVGLRRRDAALGVVSDAEPNGASPSAPSPVPARPARGGARRHAALRQRRRGGLARRHAGDDRPRPISAGWRPHGETGAYVDLATVVSADALRRPCSPRGAPGWARCATAARGQGIVGLSAN